VRLAVYLLLFGIVSFVALAATLNPLLPIDDAYITFRYVQNWVEGEGLVFNPGERVEAYSNVLWTALVAAFTWLGLTPPVAARLLSWLALIACSFVIYLLLRGRIPEAPVAVHLAAGVIFLLLPATVFHALSGMETVLTALLLVLFAWLIDLESETRAGSVLVGLTLAAISIARPEGLLFSVLVLLALGSLRLLSDDPPRLRVGLAVVCCLVPLALFFAGRWLYYGDLLPNSVIAKSAGLHRYVLTGGVFYLRKFVVSLSPVLILAAVSFIQARRDEILAVRVPALCTYLAVTLLGGSADGYPHTRYLFPLVPLLLVWAFEGGWFICRVGWEKRGPVPGSLFAFSLAALLLVIHGFLSFTEYQIAGIPSDPRGFMARPWATTRAFFKPDITPHTEGGPLAEGLGHHELAAWLQRNASRRDLVATYEIGIISYYSRLRVMDLFGLAERTISRTAGPPGLRVHPDYALGRSPKYMACRVESDRLSFYYPVFRSPEFRDGYDLVAVFPYWTTKWLLFERRSHPTSGVKYWLGWDHASDQPVTARGTGSGRTVPVATRGQVRLDPYLQWLETAQKERLFPQILNHSGSESGRDAMREWLENFRKAFIFVPEENRPAGLDYDFLVPSNSSLEFALAVKSESSFDPQSLEVSVATGGQSETLFKREFDAAADLKAGWEKVRLDLTRFGSQRVRLSFSRGKCRKPVSIAIGEPRIVVNAQKEISELR